MHTFQDRRRRLGAGHAHEELCLVVFCKHLPMEFEGSAGHFFKDVKGTDIEPAVTEIPGAAPPATKTTNWGLAFLGTAISCLLSLVGAIFLAYSSLMDNAYGFNGEICAFGLGTVM